MNWPQKEVQEQFRKENEHEETARGENAHGSFEALKNFQYGRTREYEHGNHKTRAWEESLRHVEGLTLGIREDRVLIRYVQ